MTQADSRSAQAPSGQALSGRFLFGRFLLDPAARELSRDGEAVVLPARAFDCLQYLIAHRDRAVGRDELAQAVFGRSNVSDAQIGQIVLRARRAAGDDGHAQNAIRTVPRFGFRWVAPTQVVAAPPPAVATEAPAAPPPTAAAGSAPIVPAGATAPREAREAPKAVAPQTGVPQRITLAALALLLAGIAAAWWLLRPPPRAAGAGAAQATLVLPTEVVGAEAAWARLGLMDFIADRLRRGGLAVPPSESTLALLGDAAARPAAAARDGERRVHSRAERRGGRWRVALEAVAADRTRTRASAEDADLLAAASLAGDRLLSALGHRPPPGAGDLALAERLQRARAAMLANEVDNARRILRAAPELQRDSPELLYQLARVEFREGRFEQGLAGLERALRSRAARAPLFRARLLNARGAMHVRLEQLEAASRDYAAALALADPARDHAELAIALTGRGVVRAMQRRFDAALADFGQARVQAQRAGDALSVARIDGNLGQLELDRDRPAQALQYLAQAAGDLEQYGAINELLVVRSALVAANLRLLRAREAFAQSERAWALRARVRDPAQLGTLTLDRAETLLRLGRLREARELLDDDASRHVPPGEVLRRGLLRVEAAWRGGEPGAAQRLAAALLAAPAPQSSPRLQGWLRLRQRQAALRADAAAVPWPEALPAPSWMAPMARALAERQAGREAAADAAYGQALRAVEGGGVPEDVGEVVADYVPWLIERGRLAEASALAGRVAPWAEQDFDAALLQWRLYRALGQQALAARALHQARALAGERPLPPDAEEGPAGGA